MKPANLSAVFIACLGAMDRLLSIPGAIYVGAPTRADAIYIDNTSHLLPTGLAALGYSMKVYRDRVRGHNEPYIPDHRWQEADWDTENIMDWIKALATENDARP